MSDERINELRSAYIKRSKKRAFGGNLLNISFSSGSTSFYYDTGKSGRTLTKPSITVEVIPK